jgi:hypothetical protein
LFVLVLFLFGATCITFGGGGCIFQTAFVGCFEESLDVCDGFFFLWLFLPIADV